MFYFRELERDQDSYLKTLAVCLGEEYKNQPYEQIVMFVKKSMKTTVEVNLFTARNGISGKVMFSLSSRGGYAWSHVPSGGWMCLVPRLLDLPAPRRYTLQKVHPQKIHPKCWHLLAATKAGGMHPTGMMSCDIVAFWHVGKNWVPI